MEFLAHMCVRVCVRAFSTIGFSFHSHSDFEIECLCTCSLNSIKYCLDFRFFCQSGRRQLIFQSTYEILLFFHSQDIFHVQGPFS